MDKDYIAIGPISCIFDVMGSRGCKRTHMLIEKGRAFSSRCCGLAFVVIDTEGQSGKCSEIFATIMLLYNPRVNKVFTSLIFKAKRMKVGQFVISIYMLFW